jgi:hypothetical protein
MEHAAPQPRLRCGLICTNRAKISIEGAGVASCRQVRDNGMATVSQLNPYRCDHCGTANIVAAPVLYGQGTRTYSGTFNSGTSQSYSAQVVAPPNPRGCSRTLLLWGFGIFFACFWAAAGLRAIARHPNSVVTLERPILFLMVVTVLCLMGMAFSFRSIARYNREVYPQLRWNWEHTYVCKRCGNSV